MKAIKVHGTKKKIRKLVELSKQAMREGAYRVANRLRAVAFNMEGKSAPVIAEILNVHRSKVSIWLQNWQKEGKDGILEGHRSGRPSCISQSQKRKLSEILDSGPVAYGFSSGVWTSPMVARVIEEEFSIAYHPPMCRGFFMILDFPCNGQRKFLRRQIRQRNRVGSAINTRILKKSPFRRSSDPLRGRSKFPARPHALQNMVTSRLPTGNTVNRATQYAQDLRNNRALLCSISLSISDGLQCSYISDISRTYYKGLLPKKNLFDSRQCSIPQRSGSMELVLRTPGVYRSVQSSSVFSGVQCNRESLASYTTTRHTQSILLNPKRALFNFNFDLPKYPNESIANSGLFNSISIIDYVALFIQWYIKGRFACKTNYKECYCFCYT